MRKKIIFLFVLLLLSDIYAYAPKKEYTINIDTFVFFLDGKETPTSMIIDKLNEYQPIDCSYGTRDAIMRFGEKYRGGIGFLKSINTSKNE